MSSYWFICNPSGSPSDKKITEFDHSRYDTVHIRLCARNGDGHDKDSREAAKTICQGGGQGKKACKILSGLSFRAGERVEKSNISAMEMFHQAVEARIDLNLLSVFGFCV